jgi:hypothetical protein
LGIEPVTFQFVAQCLNHCATAYPISSVVVILTKLAKLIKRVSLLMIHVELAVMRNHRNTPTAMVNSMTSSKQVNKVKPTVNRSTPDNVAVSPNQQPGGGGYNR